MAAIKAPVTAINFKDLDVFLNVDLMIVRTSQRALFDCAIRPPETITWAGPDDPSPIAGPVCLAWDRVSNY